MAFLIPNEGKSRVGTSGLPATVYFLVSSRSVSGGGTLHAVTDTLAGGVGEIASSVRKNQARPSPTSGQFDFTQMTWSDTDCNSSTAVRSIVAVTTSDNTGVVLGMWDVVDPSNVVITADVSPAGSTLKQTPSYLIQNQGGG